MGILRHESNPSYEYAPITDYYLALIDGQYLILRKGGDLTKGTTEIALRKVATASSKIDGEKIVRALRSSLGKALEQT